MQSFRSEIFAGALRNPSVLAMIGSVGAHGLFVIFSALKPAESQPTPLSIVSIDLGGSTADLSGLLSPNGLPVPNGLPPINLGEVPELSALPDVSKLGTASSQSMFLGSDPSTIGLGKLSITNPPQKSIAGSQGPVYGLNLPKTPSLSGTGSSQSPFGGQFSGNRFSRSGLQSPQSYPGYAVNPNQAPPTVNPGSIKVGGETPFTASSPLPYGSASPSPSVPESGTTGDRAAGVRERYARYLASQKQAYGQELSTQPGPRLTANYPLAACSSKVQGSALIAAIFGADGSISNKADAIQVLQSAETLELNRAAIAAVEAYRLPAPSGIPQSFTFAVDIPYSEAVCKAQSSPQAPAQASPSPTPTPQSPSTSTPSPSPSPKGSSSTVKPTPAPATSAAPLKMLPPTPTTSTTPLKAPPASVNPEPQASQAPLPKPQITPSIAVTQSPEPLPAPSIVVPEVSPTP